MEVISLNSSNFVGLSSNYAYDESVKFDQDIYYLEQGLELPFASALQLTNDTSTNNYSNLFLTRSIPLTSALYIENLEPVTQDSFSTYLAVNAVGGITNASRFMVVQDVDVTADTALVSVSGVQRKLNSGYMFTVRTLNQDLCKIEHISGNVARYLTVALDDTFYFAKGDGNDILGALSPQIFYYIYDREGDYIVLAKNIQDVPFYVALSGTSNNLTLTAPITGTPNGVPYTGSSIFKCWPRQEAPNDTKLYDAWVSYTKNSKTNSLDISPERSVATINSNLLLNSEYLTLTGTSLELNALSLKTTNTPENYQSRNNPFQSNKSLYFSENAVEMRDYKKLFTGSNQARGNDNITIGYEAFTTDIVLRKDTVTYFHVPYNFYPFTQLNVNNSGLIEAGAIAGDHPVKSDKIFKKLINAKDTSPYGTTNDEANGTFLCSWLSGSADVDASPTWVDRYYNPSKVSAVAALTSRSAQAIYYTTVFESLCSQIKDIPNTDEVFDKPSDLIFEPGTYYAYHHYGPNDVNSYVSALDEYLVEKDLQYYYDLSSNTLTLSSDRGEYAFYGNNYAVSSPLSSIQASNQFTIAFDMYNADWSKPFGHQIVGNLLNDGFGIFNENLVTPTIFVNTVSSLDILNTDLRKIKTINYSSRPVYFIRSRFGQNYSVISADGTLSRYTCDDFLLNRNTTRASTLSAAINYINNDTTAYILCSSIAVNPLKVAAIDLQSNKINVLTTGVLSPSAYFSVGAGNINQNFASTIDSYNGNFYFTPGILTRRVNNDIYYLTDGGYTINAWYDIDTSNVFTNNPVITAFRSSSRISDFNIDFDGNIWIITDAQVYCKYTQNKEFILSGSLTSNTPITNTVYLTGNGSARSFTIANSGSPLPSDYTVSNNRGIILNPAFDYTITNNTSSIVFSSPPGLSARYTVTRTYTRDTYTNNRVEYIKEIAAGEYDDRVVFVRTNHRTSPVSAAGYQFAVYTTSGQPLTSVFYTAPSGAQAFTNTDYLREHVQDVYPDANLNAKVITTNVYNPDDIQTNEIVYNLSALDPGYHHFAVRFDAYHGYMHLFIDGQSVGSVQFQPRKYKFSNLLYRPFLVGSSCFNNSMPLFEYLQKNSYLTENVKIKNFYIHNTPLNDSDITMLARKNQIIHDIHFDIACGRRNYVEEIERYFKANIPGSKSAAYNIIIRNTGITDDKLRSEIEIRIQNVLKNFAPVYTKLNNIKWIN